MNRKAALCIIFSSFIIPTEGNTVTLLPAGTANVISGKPLSLQCIYSGTNNPFTFNFYLNQDTNGLQIRVSNCIIAIAVGYNTSLYNPTCGTNNVNLTILAVSQEHNGQKWECDVSFTTADPVPPKASTIISITPATTPTTPTTPTSTTTKETVTSTSSPSTSMSSTTIKATTNSTSATHTATESTATASVSTSSSTNSATGSTATTSISTSSSTNSATGSNASASASSGTSASKSPTAESTVTPTSTSKPTNPETTGSTSTSPTNSSGQGGTDTKIIVIAVVVPIGGLLLIVIIVLCIWYHWTGKKGHDIPDGMTARVRGNNVDGFKKRTDKQLNAVTTTSDGFIIYPGPAAMSTTRPNKEKKYCDVGYQYKTPYTGYQTAYVPSIYPSAKSSTHKDTKHHNVGHIRPYTGTYGNQTAYSPKNKSYDYESPYQIATSRPAYDRTAYYPQIGYYEQFGQDVYQRGSGQYSYGQRSRPHQDNNGRQKQREYYYNQYEMADYGGSRTRYGQTKQYGLDTAIYY